VSFVDHARASSSADRSTWDQSGWDG
jgi:hypothetical protein